MSCLCHPCHVVSLDWSTCHREMVHLATWKVQKWLPRVTLCVMLTSSSINQMLPRALSSLDPYRLLVSHPFSYGSTSVITCHSHIAITITTIQNQLVVFGPPSSGLWHKGRVGTVILHRQSCDQKFGKIGHCTPPCTLMLKIARACTWLTICGWGRMATNPPTYMLVF